MSINLSLTSSHRMPFKPKIYFSIFNRRSADVLTRILFFASFAGSHVNTPHVAVTLCSMMCIHSSVSRSPRGHGSVGPGQKGLPNPFIHDYQPRICKDGFISIVFDVYPVCYLFNRVRVDNRPLLRSLPTV